MSPRQRAARRQAGLLTAPALLVLAVVTAYPVLWVFWPSLEKPLPIFDIARPAGLGHYRFLVGDVRFLAALWTTLLFTLASVALETVLGLLVALALAGRRRGCRPGFALLLLAGTPAAYALARLPGRRAWLLAIVASTALPPIATVSPLYLLLEFPASWKEFLFAYTFTATERSHTVPVALALFPGVFEVPRGDIAAAVLASLPPILVVVALQRSLIQGLVAGAVKD